MDDTQTSRTETPPRQPAAPMPPPQPAASPPPPPAEPAWRPPPAEPAWRPPPADHGHNVGLFFGIVLVLIGGWFFATRTLGLDLPRLDWGQIWPVFLIGLGAWLVIGAIRRPRRP